MTILTEPETLPEELQGKARRDMPFSANQTAISLHNESKLELITISEQNVTRSSVFIYPLTLDLTDDILIELREGYKLIERLSEREFQDYSMEEVNKALLDELQSNYTYNHKYGRTPIIEQIYSNSQAERLQEIIERLKL